MRVPPQRSSRSSTAPTTPASAPGKRLSSTSANATTATKKRKLAADAPSSGSKKKKQLSTSKRSLKKASPAAAAVKAKKSQLNKHKIVPLVGLKKIKIKEGRVTIKKILMTTGGAKAQKKQQPKPVKAVKKQVKKMTSTTALDSFPKASTSEEQLPEDAEQQKKPQAAKTKINAKKVKSVKKPKGPSSASTTTTAVPIPLTRTKKLQQRQKLKPDKKKITVKRVPVTRKIMITQKIAGGGKKKAVVTRRKQGSSEEGKAAPAAEGEDHQGVETAVQSAGSHIISVVLQSAPSTSTTEKSKGTTNKKAKEEEGAIKKKGKPKMEGSASSDNCSDSTKDKSETPKKEALKKTQKVKRPTPKSKVPTKKSAVVKVISTKLKKLPSPKAKTQQTKKSLPKKICPKEEPASDDNENSPKSAGDSHDADSSTSDEVTLDVLLMRQQMKQEPSSPSSSEKPLTTTSVKTEGASSSSINTSDDEDLKSIKNRIKVKLEKDSSDSEKKRKEQVVRKRKALGVKKARAAEKSSGGSDTEQRARRMKLFGFWSGPKRHRVASLNALAKVHCLYENEGRGAFLGICASGGTSLQRAPKPRPPQQVTAPAAATITSTRTLRSAPGLRGMGKHWDMHNASSTSSSSTSSSEDTDDEGTNSDQKTKPQQQQQQQQNTETAKNKVVKRRRKRNELMMDLKDMVVRKRMASLNASAILAASYSMEKRPAKPMESEATSKKKKKKKRVSKKVVEVEDDDDDDDSTTTSSSDVEVEESRVIEVRDNSNKKVAVIVNQDTDVTITGVYVNSTTRSTHHEGFCSIAGMQYRISSTSHTQTEATAVATETVLHTATDHPPADPPLAPPIKSYTPLGALSNMQPPGSGVVGGPPPPHHHHHPHAHPHPHAPPPCTVPPPQQPPPPHRPGPVNPGGPISPLGRRHGCTSAFSAPPPPHHHPPHPPPQGQADPAYIHGYYQPAGPLISAHHHHLSSSTSSTSSSIANSGGKVPPAVLEAASPNPTPPPSSSSGSAPPPPTSTSSAPPQQIVSVTPSGGGAAGGEESSDNDVIITATSCGGGEVVPPPPPPPPMHAHQGYRYPHQTYPPAPQPHQGYSYQSYPHTQYYPSPPATASIQYSAAPPPPPHYHSQDLCYSSTASYPPPAATYFHHKSYSTPPPPPASYHRRYIPPPQYYSDLYSSPAASNASANQSQQQSQQMVVTGSAGTGSASSYQPPPAAPPPPPPPLVDTYPPPVSIVDPYAGAPAYYGSYGAGPGAAGCYTHSPPTRSLAFIDAAYQSCPCPMQSCPKNVHTGPLTGDGKGPSKQQQQQQLPLPPVALALPLEPPGALGPPSPARGSAGMPPPPSPASASARNPNQCQEEAEFQQRTWDSATTESQSTLEDKALVKSKQEPSSQDYVGETQLPVSVDVPQDLQLKGDEETTTFPGEDAISRHGLLTISKDGVCRAKSASIHVPLLMCDYQKKRLSPVTTKSEEMPNLDSDVAANNSVKMEVRNLEKEVSVENKSTGVVQNGSKTVFRNGSSRKRKEVLPGSEVPKIETEMSVPKRRKLSTSNVVANKLSSLNTESQKTNGLCDSDDQLAEAKTKCKTAQKTQPLSSNSCSLHNAKQNARKRKLDDGKDLAENKEPLPVAAKKVQRLQTKIYPSRAKPVKKAVASSESLKKIDEILDSVVGGKERTNAEECKDVPATMKKVPGGKIADRKKETKVNGVLLHQKKPLLRHQETSGYVNGDSAKAHASQTNANRVRTEGKKSQQCRKSDTMPSSEEACAIGKKSRVNHMLRSHGLRDSLSDRSSSDNVESHVPRAKVGCSSSAMANRRISTGSRKDQPKKPTNMIVPTIAKKQSHVPGAQELGSVALMSYARKPAPRKSLQSPKWSNGWKFEGQPFESRVFTANDDMPVMRRCYALMRHQEGDVIRPRDCVLLKSGPRKTDLPFVAKVAALWENPDDGEMMVSLLWYYRPEHTDQGRRAEDMEDEIFASKHKDINSVACIEDKCYVLTFNEYCRYRKGVRRLEDGIREPGLVVPQHEDYPRDNRQPPGYVAPDLVFFCRRVYDYRQRRMLKNPG